MVPEYPVPLPSIPSFRLGEVMFQSSGFCWRCFVWAPGAWALCALLCNAAVDPHGRVHEKAATSPSWLGSGRRNLYFIVHESDTIQQSAHDASYPSSRAYSKLL